MELFIQIFLNGLAAGAVYSLVAVGYSLVYGVLRFINFAHAASIAAGAYFYLVLTLHFNLPIWVAVISAMMLTGVFGLIVNRIAYYPLRESPPLLPLLSGVAFSIIVENLIVLIFGPAPYRLSQSGQLATIRGFGTYSIPVIHLYMLAAAIIAAIAIQIVLKHSRLGRAVRATAENIELAKIRGIETETVIAVVFFISSMLAAVAGILISYETQVYPQVGTLPSLKGFVAALVGGLGNFTGTVIAALLLGLMENLLIIYLPTVYKDAVAFFVMIIFLLIRPGGLFQNFSKRY